LIKISFRTLLSLLLVFFFGHLYSQQINQEINTIAVKGITFNQVISHILSSGYAIDALDTKTESIRTKFTKCGVKNNLLNLSISVKVKDGVAVITGRYCYNVNNKIDGIPDSTHYAQAKYTYGYYKAAFIQVDKFAKSFNSAITYSKTE
jgi:hypothetical protein